MKRLLPLLLLAGCATSHQELELACHWPQPVAHWGAISGLDHHQGRLYAVHDHNRKPPAVLRFTLGGPLEERPLQGHEGHLDLEGIVRRPAGGFWLVSEGSWGRHTPNLLLRVDDEGRLQQQVILPPAWTRRRTRAGFEGVAVLGRGEAEQVVVAFQRPRPDDPPGTVELGEYRPAEGRWRFFHYPLDHPKNGLSALSFLDDGTLLVLERDNKPLFKARYKRIYAVRLPSRPGPVTKRLHLDLLQWRGRLLDCGTNGKLEGLAAAGPRHLFLVADDDGDASARLLELRW